ncbi:MAG: fatty acid desaturase [Bdellovibrionales bacterium]
MQNQNSLATWKTQLARYQASHTGRSTWQVINTLVPYCTLWYLIHWSLGVSYWLAFFLMVLAAGFLVRTFIIFHDCGHGSFFKSKKANDIVGTILGLLVFTPYLHWSREHALHHATTGNLDKRGRGDLWTLTIQEYLESPRWQQIAYRLARNPIILFIVAPAFLMVVKERVPVPQAQRRERYSVHLTNLALVGMVVGFSFVFGFKHYILIQLVVIGIAGTAGVWLFYIQHQFDGVTWERGSNWDYTDAALQGSSFYKLPKILQWFTGNIGFHHIHHLNSKIPNYRLEKCHQSVAIFQTVKPVTFFASFHALTLRLWDEQNQQMISFRQLRKIQNTRR